MNYEIIDCIDAGTEYCPCHLAESSECLLCSQLQGKNFCDCKNWKGTCIYQEFNWNKNKAKEGRKNFEGIIVEKKEICKGVIKYIIKTNHSLCKKLVKPGSFIFLRTIESLAYYDVPISVMESDLEENTLTIVIEIEGIKTKKLFSLQKNDKINIKGPYWNGVLGIKHIDKCINKNVLLIARGIGQSPIIPVVKKLYHNNNNIFVLLDKGKYNDIFIKNYLSLYKCNVEEVTTIIKGNLTQELKEFIDKYINIMQIEHLHCSGPDILIKEVIGYVNKRISTSCCNNAKMCCGEGICGACTTRFEGHVVKRLCKLQTDPEYIFEGRRLI
ncbi:MAG: sulfide/dihydroorotate dehydrogenase-like FAD/NAD-binding protein [Eubacteriaceae bacterium]